ncbi:MAG TPA: CHRD domain-containing protein, partial [Thermoanaerobaculia bacterium]|nr:CHRD domain-containing protein [Thermoanaerobaculia bacterium]
RLRIATLLLLAVAVAAGTANAASRQVGAALESLQEVPAISSTGHGAFAGTFSLDGEELEFELSYADLEGEVAQAHLHLGQVAVNGGISIFLCSNLGNGPAGTPECPDSPGMVSGTLSAADVIGPEGQGIDPGEWEEIVQAIRQGAVYANVHTDLFPGGEIRGQLRTDQRRQRP